MILTNLTKNPCIQCDHWKRTKYNKGISISEFGSCASNRVINLTKDADIKDIFAPGSLQYIGISSDNDCEVLLRTHAWFGCSNYGLINGDENRNMINCVTRYPRLFEDSIIKRELLNGVMYKYLYAEKNRAVVNFQDNVVIEFHVLKEDCGPKEYELFLKMLDEWKQATHIFTPEELNNEENIEQEKNRPYNTMGLSYFIKHIAEPKYALDIYDLKLTEYYLESKYNQQLLFVRLEGIFGGCNS